MQRLSDLFDLRYGHSLELVNCQQVHAPLGVNFVSRTLRNNGVSGRVLVPDLPGKAGEITVALGGNPLASFVQPEPFVTGRDVAILTPRDPAMSTVEKLWWCRCIWENRDRFSYGRQANRTLASLLVPDSVPNWVQRMTIPAHDGLAKSASDPVALSSPDTWSEFLIGDLFEVRKGTRLPKAARLPGSTRFIGASERNNGITDLTDIPATFKGGCLTVAYNGSVGWTFYQDEPFFACDDVNVLVPKAPTSRWAQLFVAAILKHQRSRFTYGYKWTLARMKMTSIRLPVDSSGAPDWDYMESVMRGLPFSAAIEERTARPKWSEGNTVVPYALG